MQLSFLIYLSIWTSEIRALTKELYFKPLMAPKQTEVRTVSHILREQSALWARGAAESEQAERRGWELSQVRIVVWDHKGAGNSPSS